MKDKVKEELINRGWDQSQLEKPYQDNLIDDILEILNSSASVEGQNINDNEDEEEICPDCGSKRWTMRACRCYFY